MDELHTDETLMLAYRDGDGAAFEVLYARHRGSLFRYLLHQCGQRELADELFQEIWMSVIRARSGYEVSAKFTTWLFRIATHLALNALRDGKNERLQERLDDDSGDMPVRQVSDHRPSVEQRMVYQAKLDEVRRAIAALPEKQRAAVLMHKYEEMEYSQIAKVLSCSESAVKSLLFRAYETLRARLAHMA